MNVAANGLEGQRLWNASRGEVLLTTDFDYKGIKTCNAVALVPTSFRRLQETSRFLRSPKGLNLKAFDFVAADRLARNYLLDNDNAVRTMELAFNDHAVGLVVVIHNVELVLPKRFKSRTEEKDFHKERMLKFARKVMRKHPGSRVLPVYVEISEDGKMLIYKSFEELLHGGNEEIIWHAEFAFRDVARCEFLVLMCLDFRFRRETFDMLRASYKLPYFHLVGTAGSCQGLIGQDPTVIKSVRQAIERGACRAIIVNHQGCAAYKRQTGGMNDLQEREFHEQQIELGSEILTSMGIVETQGVYAQLIGDGTRMQFVAA